jgi:isopentenyl-diphosphate delta-isomerase
MGLKMSGLSTKGRGRGPEGERVVLLDERANPIGTADKALVHHASTPLHLAFSCYLFDEAGDVLVTRRALSKPTWPGVWTNSFCGHPEPGETPEAAVVRRARQELGAEIRDLRLSDPEFRYCATDPDGVVENEVCPVYEATISGSLSPRPDEVMEWAWVSPASLARAVLSAPFAFSPWMVLQIPALERAAKPDAVAPACGGSEGPGA